jgi:hypothetical protein
MRYALPLVLLVCAGATVGPSTAATRSTAFGVSATVVYNCAMDMSKLTDAQRKVVEDYCRKQSGSGQQPAPAK